VPRFYEADFAAIDLRQMADYLISMGWRLEEQISNKATIWDSPDGRHEIWVPLRRDFRDFQRVLESSFLTLEEAEGRPLQSVLRDMALRWADVTRFRVNTGNFGTGSIPLPAGMKLLDAARDIISASVRWLTEKKAVYYTRPHERVSEFLRHLQMGQTEVGSFVLTVISPLAEPNASFSRQAISQVYAAVSAAKELAEKAIATNSIERTFSSAVDRGVNANLCEALTSLGALSPDGQVEVRFSWAVHEHLSKPQGEAVLVSEMNLRAIGDAAEYLRRLEPEVEVELSGLVGRTKERGGSGDYRESELEMKALFDGRVQTVRLNVKGERRHRAFDATDRRLPIRVRGILDRSRIPLVLSDISRLDVVEEGQMMNFLDMLTDE
jgi:hypothetical protein